MKQNGMISHELSPLNRGNEKPLYIQLADSISEYITKNQLLPGDALPSENELIAQFSVSRITVRNAVQRLNTEGIVKKIHGKGVFVSEQKYNFIENITNIEEHIAEQGLSISDELIEAGVFYPAQIYLKELKLEKGSGETAREEIGTLTQAQLEKIAKEKMDDLNTDDVEAAKKIVAGTARSMGVKVAE